MCSHLIPAYHRWTFSSARHITQKAHKGTKCFSYQSLRRSFWGVRNREVSLATTCCPSGSSYHQNRTFNHNSLSDILLSDHLYQNVLRGVGYATEEYKVPMFTLCRKFGMGADKRTDRKSRTCSEAYSRWYKLPSCLASNFSTRFFIHCRKRQTEYPLLYHFSSQ